MRPPPDLLEHLITITALMILTIDAEVCPIENPTDTPTTATASGDNAVGPVKKLLLKPKSCPDFKDDEDQSHCCPSRITFGSFYCCTLNQKHQIESEIASERRKQFVKKYLAVIIIVTISLAILGIVIASMICKRVRFCPLHHSKASYLNSGSSFQTSSIHGASRYYRPVDQQPPVSRHSTTFNALNSSPPQLNKPPNAYEAPPPYESCTAYRPLTGAHLQHQYNRVLENELNGQLERCSPTETNRTNSVEQLRD
ncbi:hypothetical protein M3Y98_00239600 [Aphelenchoides besseyi]|nr:hypothetical protein M3Y98_00239600 [Aphelenchoides besseyi]